MKGCVETVSLNLRQKCKPRGAKEILFFAPPMEQQVNKRKNERMKYCLHVFASDSLSLFPTSHAPGGLLNPFINPIYLPKSCYSVKKK